MSGDRPPPRYGEYATPEEQAAAIRERLDPEQSTGTGASGPPPAVSQAASPEGSAAGAERGHRGPDAGPTTGPLMDRFVTLFLLGMGVVSLLQGIGGYLNLGVLIDAGYESMGAALGVAETGHYTATAVTGALGWLLTIVHTIALTLAVYYSLRRLRARRTSWWIPVLGAAVVFLVTMIVMFVLLILDPAFQAMVAAGS